MEWHEDWKLMTVRILRIMFISTKHCIPSLRLSEDNSRPIIQS